ncbi:hypothetical protein J1N35_042568 [Gossypium stocksii]|uniref:U-box domain-containing protein n=1 Tax=Gossypium stocksii TaxID=47602 RepID=A0A9D3ZE47_9ROSI|nr:hypothetical protein J1N35_042568 [Gossypium stocksii]
MSSDEITLNVFQDDPIRAFNCGPDPTGRPGSKTRDPTSFIDDKMFSFPPLQPPEFRSSNSYAAAAAAAAAAASADRRGSPNHHQRNWGSSPGGGSTNSGDDELDGDDVDDDEEDEDDDDDPNENNISNKNHNININNHINKNNNSGNETVNNAGSADPERMGNGKAKHSFVGGSCRELVVKEGGNGVRQGLRESNSYQNAVTIADPDGDLYYTQYSHGGEGSASVSGANGQKDIIVAENGGGCGFSGRKDVSFLSESSDPLRAIFSDPITGALMDDAMILPCGHSFSAAGLQHVLRMKVCYTCSQSVSEASVAPNLSLRAAVQAFRHEEELQFYRSPKRRRDRFDQDKSSYGDPNTMDPPRNRGVQFPFAVTDRVIIKGNKRTPQRFVGREAVVTTQCLNGWYVVKTLDNAESVKLQYRSLAKVTDNTAPKPITSKMGPNWL